MYVDLGKECTTKTSYYDSVNIKAMYSQFYLLLYKLLTAKC